MKLTATLHNAQQGHAAMAALWHQIKPLLFADHRLVVTVKKETRSSAQNSRLWAMLTDVSQQVDWYGKKLTAEDWKHVFTASLKRLDVVPNIDGTGFVALGMSTSKMTRAELSELLEFIEAFGAQQGVRFTAPEHMETA